MVWLSKYLTMLVWWTFVVIMALGQFAPGPDMLLLTRTALSRGRGAGCATAFGISCGLMLHASLAVAGVAAILADDSIWSRVLSLLASGYLLWLGWQLVKAAVRGQTLEVGELSSNDRSYWYDWLKGFLCNVLNPKVALFLAGVVTPFLGASSDAWWSWLLWGTIWLQGWLLWSLWAWVLQVPKLRRGYAKLVRWIDLGFGLLLWVMAGTLVGSLV